MINGRSQSGAELRGPEPGQVLRLVAVCANLLRQVEQVIPKSGLLAGVENLLVCLHIFQVCSLNTVGAGTVAWLEVRARRRRALIPWSILRSLLMTRPDMVGRC